jgi:hypothetical protein
VQDKIMNLCTRLVAEDDPGEIRPVAARLQSAIHERVERVRESAFTVALVDQIVGWEVLTREQGVSESAT